MTVEEVIGTLFQGEDQQLIQSLISISSMKQYKKGQDIYECGIEPKDFIFLSVALLILICRMRISSRIQPAFFQKNLLIEHRSIDVKTRVELKPWLTQKYV